MSTFERRKSARGTRWKGGTKPEDAGEASVPLPHDSAIEDRVLGTVLVDNGAADETGILEGRHFHDTNKGLAFDAALSRIKAGQRATPDLIAATFPTGDGDNELIRNLCNGATAKAVSRPAVAEYAQTLLRLAELQAARKFTDHWGAKALERDRTGILDDMRSAIDAAADRGAEEEDDAAGWQAVYDCAAELYQTQGENHRRRPHAHCAARHGHARNARG